MSDFAKVLTAYDETTHALNEIYSELLALAGSAKVTQAERMVIHERIGCVLPAIKSLRGET